MPLSILEKRVGHREAAQMLGMSVRSLFIRVHAGKIPAYRHGQRFIYRVADLQAYLDQIEPVIPRGEEVA